MRKAIHSKRIVTPYGIKEGYLLIEDSKIIGTTKSMPEVDEIVDYEENYIIPGIIDIHNHGFGGWSMDDPVETKDIQGYVKALLSVGVTGVLATAKEVAFEAIANFMDTDYEGARIHGIYSEGPYWSRGGENLSGKTWPAPDVKHTQHLINLCQGKMKMMAIAPEVKGAYDVIRLLHQNGIKVAACHTKAKAQDIKDAMEDVGLDIVTHLCNGMQGIHHRDVGALGAFLLQDNLTYELTTDLNHVCKDMIHLCFRIQSYDKFCLISDSNYIAGLPVGFYERDGKIVKLECDGSIKDINKSICGSGKWVLFNMGQLVNVVGVPFEEVVKMASLNPARFLGIDAVTGSLESGKLADFAVINDDYECLATYISGKKVYDAKSSDNGFNMEALKRRVSSFDSK